MTMANIFIGWPYPSEAQARTDERISAIDSFYQPGPGRSLFLFLSPAFRHFSRSLLCIGRIIEIFLLPALRSKAYAELHPLPHPSCSRRVRRGARSIPTGILFISLFAICTRRWIWQDLARPVCRPEKVGNETRKMLVQQQVPGIGVEERNKRNGPGYTPR